MHKTLLVLVVALQWGCSSDKFYDGSDGGGVRSDGWLGWEPIVPSRPKCPNLESTISGTVFAPNGTDPVPGATVFIPASLPELFPPAVKCEVCGSLGTSNNLWTTTTSYDGKFTLAGVCPGQWSVVFQNGRFRRLISVNVPAAGKLNILPAQSRLPKRNAEFTKFDSIPKIALATGDYDKMECVLRKIGLNDNTYDFYEGAKYLKAKKGYTSFSKLVNDLNKMRGYNIIFINCTDNTFEDELNKSAVLQNILSYVQEGGRLYVTDWSYDWIEQVKGLSPFIDFEPGQSGADPETVNKAAIGANGLIINADIMDSNMAKWLGLFPGVIAANRSRIEHFLVYWVMMYGLSKDVKLWVQGTVSAQDGSVATRLRPLTVTFNFKNCGKILFTSYHTEGRDEELKLYPLPAKDFPNYCSQSVSPQDRILEYLIFDIANCIKPVG